MGCLTSLRREVLMKLHASGEDYLETILVLQKKLGMGRPLSHNGRRSLTGAILPFLFYKIAGLVAEMAVDPSHQLSLCLIAELGLVVERTTHQPVRVLAGDDAAHPVALLRIRTEFIRTPKAGLALLSSATYPSRRLA